jgi:hypothetical protein
MPNYAILDLTTKKPYLGNKSWDSREAAEVIREDLLKYHPPGNEWHERLIVAEINRELKPPDVPKGKCGGTRNAGKTFPKKPPRPKGHEPGLMLRLGPARGAFG